MSSPNDESEALEFPLPDGQTTLLCVIQQLLGFDRARVFCSDGKVRLCRIPGKFKKRMWMKVGDVVLVAPWDFQPERGDIIYRYTSNELQKLEKKGLLKELKELLG
ncbi:translation initiation factor aIF-1A [Thermofilum pendens]|uniref:Translation initiation factor 1A n=1 Tax=Thermofilum pendens (strain DSM 2475 / Hrk 5) TaxID=368408 RepID=A1RXA3_THEPD|nr:translation initiation factor aIF-1A [Thermofilum pendens]ABL77833.1 translation initiation factor 1A (aeIF-1A) [Thermofilum pendens Hrk 5]